MIVLLKTLFVQIYIQRFQNIHKIYDLYIKSLIMKEFLHKYYSFSGMFPFIKI